MSDTQVTVNVTVNGCRYHVRTLGQGRPLLLLHGFTGSSASWLPLMQRLADDFQCVAVDLLGHGQSDAPAASQRYAMPAAVADLEALMTSLGFATFACLGYSMGGRLALSLALTAPTRVSRLVLESASPGLETEVERASRVSLDEALARALEVDGVVRFVDRWEQLPLFASQAKVPPERLTAQRHIRLSQRAFGLAASLRGMGTGAQPSWWSHLADLTVPTLLVTGDEDEKFTAIAVVMQSLLPHAVHLRVPDAGHAVHLERSEDYVAAVRDYLVEASWPGDQGA